MAYHSVNRLIDYQDEAYAEQWLACLASLIDRDQDRTDYALSYEAGRHLALWMAYEDIPRVAQLKVRPTREDQIRSEVKADAAQPMTVAEFFHPRVEEIAALLPLRLGSALLRSNTARRALGRVLGPRTLRTDRISMQLVFRGLSGLRRFRRSTLGYAHEYQMIERWFEGVLTAEEHAQAMAIAALGGMVKGYGDTRYRTTSRLMAILDYLDTTPDVNAEKIAELHSAAMTPDAPFGSVEGVVAAAPAV